MWWPWHHLLIETARGGQGASNLLHKSLYNPHFTVCTLASFHPHPRDSHTPPPHIKASTVSYFLSLLCHWDGRLSSVSLFSDFKIQLKSYLLKHILLILVLVSCSLLNMILVKITSSLRYLIINSLRSGTRLYIYISFYIYISMLNTVLLHMMVTFMPTWLPRWC